MTFLDGTRGGRLGGWWAGGERGVGAFFSHHSNPFCRALVCINVLRSTCFSVLMFVMHRQCELSVTSLIMGDSPVAAAAAIAALEVAGRCLSDAVGCEAGAARRPF